MARGLYWWALASAGLMVVGGIAPWANAFDIITISGTDGDGWFLIVGGLLAGGLLLVRMVNESPKTWFVVVALVLALLCVLVAIVDLADISGLADDGGEGLSGAVSAEWGLYLSLLASLSLSAAAIAMLVAGRGAAPAGAATPSGFAPGVAAPGAPPVPQGEPVSAGASPGAQPPPADWYPDPHGQKRLRYWDGSAWTSHTAD